MTNNEKPKLTVYTPISLELGEENRKKIIEDILERHAAYGLDYFLLDCPSKGWRAVHHPEPEHYEALARQFCKIRDAVAPYGITCAWWLIATIKAGRSPQFPPMIRADGSETPFSSCPLDDGFKKNFGENARRFVKIAKPEMIFLEDDYSISASTFSDGCYCERHLDEFAKRVGKRYTREELAALFRSGTPEAKLLNRKWKALMRDTMVWLSEELRRAVDTEAPETPIALMEPGSAISEGNMTEAVARALAGPRHRPICRVCGTGYNGFQSVDIPSILYHPLWFKECTPEPFCFIHESDTYPHTRFYSSALQMRALMGAVYSFGYEGSVFQTQSFLDDTSEENGFADMISKERTRFAAVSAAARECHVCGVSVPSDADLDAGCGSDWVRILTHWGIPFTTHPSAAAFWDERRAGNLPDDIILAQLGKGLFIDGAAAKKLTERGYGKYLGVSVGADAAVGMRKYDLAIHERIRDGFAAESVGRKMPGANCFSCKGNGILFEMTVTDERCEVITETYDFEGRLITPSMTRFENELGGRVVVIGTTINGNQSQSLYNYRRQKLIGELIEWLGGDLVMVKNEPKVYPVMNVPKEKEAGYLGMLTLENFSEDERESVTLHLPAAWRNAADVSCLDRDGEWRSVPFTRTEDGVTVLRRLPYLVPTYFRFR